MKTITINKTKDINLQAMKDALKTQFGSRYKDFNETGYGDTITVYLNSTKVGDTAAFQAIFDSHNSTTLTTEQIGDKRREAYGSINDQLDMIYWDKVNGTTLWKDHVSSVKQSNPKS